MYPNRTKVRIAAVPRGAHKNFGGWIDAPAAVAGVAVHPGDLVLGDGDGVVVVPLDPVAQTLLTVEALQRREEEFSRRLERGEALADLVMLEPCTVYDRHGREVAAAADGGTGT